MNKKGEISVSVYLFRDEQSNSYVAYCPSLNLCGNDTTMESAKESFDFVLNEYLSDMSAAGTLESDLLSHGWCKTENGFTAPSLKSQYEVLCDILSDNDEIDFQKYHAKSQCLAFA